MTEFHSHSREILSSLRPHKKISLFIGPGPRAGAVLAARVAAHGYKTSIVTRSGTNRLEGADGHLSLGADMANPDPAIITEIFAATERNFLGAPSIIVYNAATLTESANGLAALEARDEEWASSDPVVRARTPLLVAEHAVRYWSKHESHGVHPKLFIYIGDVAKTSEIPSRLLGELGIEETAAENWIEAADRVYESKGFRFIYADQQKPGGGSVGSNLQSAVYGDFISKLVHIKAANVPSHAVFYENDEGLIEFS